MNDVLPKKPREFLTVCIFPVVHFQYDHSFIKTHSTDKAQGMK